MYDVFFIDVCECLPSIYNTGSSLPPPDEGGEGKRNIQGPIIVLEPFQRLCFGVAAEPCLCILNTTCIVCYVYTY